MAADFSGIRRVVPPVNEPIRSYAPGTPERAAVKARLAAATQLQVNLSQKLAIEQGTMIAAARIVDLEAPD